MSSRSASLVLAAWLVAAAAPAGAETAKEAYNRGLSLYAAGSYREAADAFLAAYKLKPKALILFNVGQAYRKHGDGDQARVYYRRFLDEASPDQKKSLEAEVRGYLAELDAARPPPPEPAPAPAVTPPAAPTATPRPTAPPPATPATPPATTATTTTAPATTATTTPTPPTPPTTTAPPPATEHAATPPAPKASVARNPWLWSAIAVVAAGLAVGLGVGLGVHNDPSTTLGTRQPSF